MYDTVFVHEWPWWAGGLAIGLFVISYSFVYNKIIGMSSSLESAIREWKNPLIPKRGITMDFGAAAIAFAKERGLDLSEMGLPTLKVSAKLAPPPIELSARWIVLGVILGGLLGGVLEGREWMFTLGPAFDSLFPVGQAAQALILLFGGLCVGFGARMAGGCPSGHGLGGLSTLSVASLVAVAGYFVSGISITFLLRWLAQ